MLIVILLVLTCGRSQDEKEYSQFFRNRTAQWITDGRPLPKSDSLFYLDRQAPLFRKEFSTDTGIENARLIITAAGYYRASLNGKDIGDNVLDPAWTDFSKRIYYCVSFW